MEEIKNINFSNDTEYSEYPIGAEDTEKENKITLCGIDRLRWGTDGDGITTLVAAVGCPLRCKYCLNPHSWNGKTKGKSFTVDELFDFVKIDNLYFQKTGGGITFGGGEPLLYASFIHEFIQKYKHLNWKFYIETAISTSMNDILLLLDDIDKWYVDVKTLDSDIYKEYTGRSAEIMYINLLTLKEKAKDKVRIRLPLIPGYTTQKLQNEHEKILKEDGFEVEKFTYTTDISPEKLI